jgi:thiamine kinase-like enzyme
LTFSAHWSTLPTSRTLLTDVHDHTVQKGIPLLPFALTERFMPVSIEDVIAQIPGWDQQSVRHTLITGGLSHQVARVDTADGRYILRVLDPNVSRVGLGIPLDQEIENTVRAAESGVGPRVFSVLADVPALILEFIEGPTLSAPDVRDPATIPRIAAACRRLHDTAGRFVNDFDISAKLSELLTLCHEHDLRIPDGYEDHLATVRDVGAALAARPLPVVPCHNDLLAENFIDDGESIRIVDYQLSGMNDPAFELGDIAAEADFDPDLTSRLAAAYFGTETSPALVARVRLNLLLSNFTWTLWFSVHHGMLDRSNAGFDYWHEAADKWRQAVRDLSDPGLGRLLDTARGRP